MSAAQQSRRPDATDLELVKVDATFNNGLGGPGSLHERDDQRGAEQAQALIGGLDPESCTPNEGYHAEPAVPVHQLGRPGCCDDVRDGLGEQHTPCPCIQECFLRSVLCHLSHLGAP